MTGEWMSGLAWWQWALLLALPPAIFALYFLKLRRQPVEVPSTYLWRRTVEDLHVNSLWQRLRQNLLLLLQILFVGLLILALAWLLLAQVLEWFGWRSAQLVGQRHIFVVDNSASMNATDVAPTRLDEARRRVAELIDEMKAGDSAMLISFARGARVEQPFTNNRSDLRRRLAAITPTHESTSLAEALRLATGLMQVARGEDVAAPQAGAATLYVFSDGRFADVTDVSLGGLQPVFVPIGTAAPDNVAITALTASRHTTYDDRVELFARLENFGAAPVEVPLELRMDGVLADADRVALDPGQGRGVAFDLGERAAGVVELMIERPDVLAVDNRAWAIIEPPGRMQVALVTAGNEPLELALATPRARELAEVSVFGPDWLNSAEYQRQAATGAWDLLLFDHCRPAAAPEANTWYIGVTPPGDAWPELDKVETPQIIDVDQTHPLVQILDVSDVLVLESQRLRPPAGGTTLIDSNQGPLLAIAPRDGHEDVVLGFELLGADAVVTNWTTRRSFPVFVLNLLAYFSGQQLSTESVSLAPGVAQPLRLNSSAASVAIVGPDGFETLVTRDARNLFYFGGAANTGVYEARAHDAVVGRFAVNLLDARESDLSVRADAPLRIGHVEVAGRADWQPARPKIWRWLLMAALALLLFEWYVFNRRAYL